MGEGNIAGIVAATIFGFLILFLIVGSFVEAFYINPISAEKANQICQEQGFDYYDDYKLIGPFSTEPVAIKCKYVDNYQKMDIKLRQTYSSKELIE